MSRVSVVIVNFNTCEALRACLGSIEAHHEVIVVDNASHDGSVEMVQAEFPSARLLVNSMNRGFGAANNQGRKIATRSIVLYLNSDARATQGAIDALVDSLVEFPKAVTLGGRLLNSDGSLQNSSANELTLWAVFCEQFFLERLFPSSRLLSPYWNTSRLAQSSTPSKSAQVMGACLMTPSTAEFDEDYFLYCEDTDLCKRLSAFGEIYYVPAAIFYHDLGASSKASRWLSVARYNRGKELYFRKHHGKTASVLCWIINRKGALLRMLFWSFVALLKPEFMVKAQLFLKVLFAPLEGPPRPDKP